MKPCSCCKEVKPFDDFPKNSQTKTGYNAYCRSCASVKWREFKLRHGRTVRTGPKKTHEERKAQQREYYYANKDNYKREYEAGTRKPVGRTARVLEIERASRERNRAKNRLKHNERQSRRRNFVGGSPYLVTEKDLKRIYTSPCISCGSTGNQSMEHLIPLSRGGNHSIGNLTTLCLRCNMSKGSKLFSEWRYSKWRTSPALKTA